MPENVHCRIEQRGGFEQPLRERNVEERLIPSGQAEICRISEPGREVAGPGTLWERDPDGRVTRDPV
jgi:hypothetical protein